mmetsp:Transcript_10022/g.24990  ORF Transcript_10022/g.24990 Transcript_10022/m.24990 type:complete len:220 (+) Transcript_10022:141-800(+)
MRAWMSAVPSYVFTVSRLVTCRITWYSSTMPLPPSMSRAWRATPSAFMQLLRLIRDVISGTSSPLSFSRPTCRQPSRPNEISVCMSAKRSCISCRDARGDPNMWRSSVYCRALWKQNSAAPSAPHAMPYRAELRHVNGPFKPFTVVNMELAGTSTSSRRIMPVMEERSESFPSILGVLTPLRSVSTTKPRISPASSFAQTIATSAMGEFVIQVLEPLRM